MTREELETLQKIAKKIAEKRKTYEERRLFQDVLKSLNKVPEVEGRYVQRTGNDFFGRSWERGLKVSYQKGKGWELLKHKASVSYEDIFPHTRWREDTDKSIAEQLFDLYVSDIINAKTAIKFEFLDWEDKTYDRSKKITVPFEKILPEVLKIIQKSLPSDPEIDKDID